MSGSTWLIRLLIGAVVLAGVVAMRLSFHERAAEMTPVALVAAEPPRSGDLQPTGLPPLNPFRIDRRITRVPHAPPIDGPTAAVADTTLPRVTRPPWTLTGVILGPSPVAVLEGVSGSVGSTLVAVGDLLGPVRIVEIGGDFVRVAQDDASWTIGLGQPVPADGRQ